MGLGSASEAQNLDSYIKLIDRRVVNSDIFPQVIMGLSDTSASMREATIRVMIPLTPLLDRENQEKMVRGLGSLQADPLPAIRTNILVCLNHIVADLEASVRRQVAFFQNSVIRSLRSRASGAE